MRIRTNLSAMVTFQSLQINNRNLSKDLERLSTGMRINSAGDDAAGLAISEKMRRLITGMDRARDNVKEGISLVQTGEAALQEVHGMLNRMLELAGQSANGTYDKEVDRANLQKELGLLTDEVDRIASSVNFNGVTLFQDEGPEAEEALYQNLMYTRNLDTAYATSTRTTQTLDFSGAGSQSAWTDGETLTLTLAVEDGTAKSLHLDVKVESNAAGNGVTTTFVDENGITRGSQNGAYFNTATVGSAFAAVLGDSALAKTRSFSAAANGSITCTAKETGSGTAQFTAAALRRKTGTVSRELNVRLDTVVGGDPIPAVRCSSIRLYDGTNADKAVFQINGRKFAVGLQSTDHSALDSDVRWIGVKNNFSGAGDTNNVAQVIQDDLRLIAAEIGRYTGLEVEYSPGGVGLNGGGTAIRNLFLFKGYRQSAAAGSGAAGASGSAYGLAAAPQPEGGGSTAYGARTIAVSDLLANTPEDEINIIYSQTTYSVSATQTPGADNNLAMAYWDAADILQKQIVPQIVQNIMTNYPAFKYLTGSTIGIGLSVDSTVPYNTMAYVRNQFSYNGNFQTYTLGVNPSRLTYLNNPDRRNELERTIAHEMIHAFMDEALTVGMVGKDSGGTGQFPMWFIEGMAQTASGPGNWITNMGLTESMTVEQIKTKLGSVSGQLSKSDEGRTASGGDFTAAATQAQYGTGYLACMYLGWKAGGGTTSTLSTDFANGFNAANRIANGLKNILYPMITGTRSLDDMIAGSTGNAFASTADFESNFKNNDEAAAFVKALLPYTSNGMGGIVSGNLANVDPVPNEDLTGVNLFALDTTHASVTNTYDTSTVTVFSGAGTSVTGSPPVSGITDPGAVAMPTAAYPTNPFDTAGLGDSSKWEYDAYTGTLMIKSAGSYTITSLTGLDYTGRIKIADGAGAVNLTLKNANIDMSGMGGNYAGIDIGDGNTVTMTIADGTTNTVKAGGGAAGIQLSASTNDAASSLTIKAGSAGTGTLEVTGGPASDYSGAGIGAAYQGDASNSSITVESGTITANGGKGGAGIGGGYQSKMGAITINSGTITTQGGEGGAGIGCGDSGSLTGDITVTGGTINSTAGAHGAGIGGGWNDNGIRNIVISGGDIRAISIEHGTGIGAGCSGRVNNITIGGDATKIYAEGGNDGAAIGAGCFNGSRVNNITISGGVVEAVGGSNGSGIGSGSTSSVGAITISGGVVKATGQTNSSGIGSGYNGTVSSVTITGGTVSASGGWTGGGGNIGGYSGANATNPIDVTISAGANVKAGSGSGKYITTSVSNAGGAKTAAEDTIYSLAITNANLNAWMGVLKNDGVDGNEGTLDVDNLTWPLADVTIKTTGGDTLRSGTLNAFLSDSADFDTDTGAYIWTKGQDLEVTVTDGEGNTSTFNLLFSPDAGDWYMEGTPPPDAAEVPTYQNAGGGGGGGTTPPTGGVQGDLRLGRPRKSVDGIILQVGAERGDTLIVPRFYFSASALGMEKLDISDQAHAAEDVDRLKTMINRVSDMRGSYGALQNTLEHINDNLSVSIENLTAAESQIRDTDYAVQMMDFIKDNILGQAAQMMLAQANQQPEQVLALLR